MKPCGDGGATFHALLADYRSLLARGLPPPAHAFPPLLRACAVSSSVLLPLGLALHLHALLLGHFPADPFVCSSLLHLYSSSGCLPFARRVFDEIPLKSSVVPWSALIAAYSRAGRPGSAFSLLHDMRQSDVRPNSVTFLSLLPLDLVPLQCLHASVVRHGFEPDLVLANSLVSAYGRCRVALARRLFDSMPLRDVISWNSLLSGYSRIGCVREAFDLFTEMRSDGIYADHRTYASLLSSVVNSSDGGGREGLVRSGKLVHAALLTSGHELDAHVETALTGMYLKYGVYGDAFLLFERSSDRRDVVSWTAMISGLVQSGAADKALIVFHQMLRSGPGPAGSTLASAFSACAQLGSSKLGASIHGHVFRRGLHLDVPAQNSLVSMYAKGGHLRQSLYVFQAMEDRDLVSWNSVISGCAQNGHLAEAFFLFGRMRAESQRPDTITVVALFQVCAAMGALHHGKLVHCFVIRQEIDPSIALDTSLVDMYAKCGDLRAALRCFASMPEQDLVSWGAIIAGYGSHGMGELALRVYKDFRNRGMEPNDVIFLAVLSACSHAGLVSEGLRILKSMTEQFSSKPSLEHWGCVIDLLCRAGRLEEALGFANTMTPRPNADILGMLLDACRTNGLVALAEVVAKQIAALRPDSANSYVQLAHSYAAMRRWDGVGEAWVQMRERGLKKAPAWSFVELNGIITTFFAEHQTHSQQDEILFLLKVLNGEMREISGSSTYRRWESSMLDSRGVSDKEEKAYNQDSADGEEEMAFEEAIDGGEEETAYKEAAVDVEEDTADEEAAATAGDRDAAVELLEEIRALKDERSDLQRERANLVRDLSDARTKLAGAESDLKAVAGQASRLEGELRIIQDDLSTANIVSMEQEEKENVRRLNSSIKDVEAKFKVKISDLETTVKVLEEELRVSKQKERDEAEKFAAVEEELMTKIAELRSKLEIDKEEKKAFEIDGKVDAGVLPVHFQALRTSAMIGIVALAAGSVVCLQLAKRR
ncbi:unnamed protein product [Musa textilis]